MKCQTFWRYRLGFRYENTLLNLDPIQEYTKVLMAALGANYGEETSRFDAVDEFNNDFDVRTCKIILT